MEGEVEVCFEAQAGPQKLLLACPADQILFGGARGGGKSYGVLGHYFRHQEEYGRASRGLLIRRTYPELEDIVGKAKDLYKSEVEGGFASWNDSKKIMKFRSGAELKFRYLDKDKDADRYQGHEYSWICIEEAGNFPNPEPLDKLWACLRSAVGVKKFYLLTANPGGVGHSWLKSRFIDAAKPNQIHDVVNKVVVLGKETETRVSRVFIPSRVSDNRILLKNDPNYISNVVASAGGQEWLLKAWLEGEWNIIAGGMFNDVWRDEVHILPRFKVPSQWKVFRSFDWGSSKPFSVGWWCVCDEGFAAFADGDYRSFYSGTVIRIGEWYGWNGTPNTGLRMLENDFLRELKVKEELIKERYGVMRVYDGPADSAIFTVQDGTSIAEKHEMGGIAWYKIGKEPGSRIHAWQEIRQLLGNSLEYPLMENKGLFITEDCLQFKRTVPVMQRDSKNLDDIDTDGEDHICDETGYFVRWDKQALEEVELVGI